MNRTISFLIMLVLVASTALAQQDKAEADSLVQLLLANGAAPAPPDPLTVLSGNHIKGEVFKIQGKHYQVKTLRNDVYYRAGDKMAVAIDNARFPMETMNNLLLGAIAGKDREVNLVHHQYGGQFSTLMMPFDELMGKLKPGKEIYCSVTSINEKQVEGVTVFYDRKKNAIHMLQVVAPLATITTGKGEMSAHLYTNIPQNGIKELFGVEPAPAKPTGKRQSTTTKKKNHRK